MVTKVIYLTGNRSDYGLMERFLIELSRKEIDLGVGLVFDKTYIEDIKESGLNIYVDFSLECTKIDMFSASLNIVKQGGKYFQSKEIDFVIGMGDRWEMMAAFYAAFLNNIPIIHFSGGEVTIGSMDNIYRSVMSKFAKYHFVAMEEYKNNLINMGIDEKDIFVVGEVGLWDLNIYSYNDLKDNLPFDLPNKYIVLSLHQEYPILEKEKIDNFIRNVIDLGYTIIASAPSLDAGRENILYVYDKYKDNIIYKEHFGRKIYLSLMKYAQIVIGNSSSGIVEAPSLNVPIINVGNRQKGRIKSKQVIDISWDSDLKVIVEKIINQNITYNNPYYNDHGFYKALEKVEWIIKKEK